jgi:hypothetical protein
VARSGELFDNTTSKIAIVGKGDYDVARFERNLDLALADTLAKFVRSSPPKPQRTGLRGPEQI